MVANLDTRIEVTPRPNESIKGWEKRIDRAIILETAVGSQKSTQALGALTKIKKCLITNKVTTNFFISPCTPIPYASFLRPTAVSRIILRENDIRN